MSAAASSDMPPPAAKAKAKAGGKAKARGRAKAVARPQIDLDKEIEEANTLATMSRKLMVAARSIERNNKKCKSRLIRKAGKLSAEDLERIAVLKRCGLYSEAAEAEDGNEGEGDDASEAASSGSSAARGLEPKKQKLATLLAESADARALMDGVRGAFPSLLKAGTGRVEAVVSEPVAQNAGRDAASDVGDSQLPDDME